MTVVLDSCFVSSSINLSWLSGSSADVASSSTVTSGRCRKIRANANRCLSPPESVRSHEASSSIPDVHAIGGGEVEDDRQQHSAREEPRQSRACAAPETRRALPKAPQQKAPPEFLRAFAVRIEVDDHFVDVRGIQRLRKLALLFVGHSFLEFAAPGARARRTLG